MGLPFKCIHKSSTSLFCYICPTNPQERGYYTILPSLLYYSQLLRPAGKKKKVQTCIHFMQSQLRSQSHFTLSLIRPPSPINSCINTQSILPDLYHTQSLALMWVGQKGVRAIERNSLNFLVSQEIFRASFIPLLQC